MYTWLVKKWCVQSSKVFQSLLAQFFSSLIDNDRYKYIKDFGEHAYIFAVCWVINRGSPIMGVNQCTSAKYKLVFTGGYG